MEIILKPFSWLLMFFYETFNSYGLALILFAVVIKLILFPVTLKGKKSMIQTTMLSGKMQQLQKQYGKDRERYNLEVQKLYEREKVNPMGGCLWSLIPLILLIALFYIIREPLTHFMSLSAQEIALLAEQLNWSTEAVAHGWVSQSNMDKLLQQLSNGEITTVFQNGSYNQVYLASLINEGNLPALQAAMGEAGSKLFAMDFTFLGLNLASIPSWKFWVGGLSAFGLFLLPLVSTGVSFLSMKVSMATNKINNQVKNDQMDKTNRMMMYTMPLMSLWIGFTVPAGLSIYWIAQYLVTMVQEVICAKLLKKDYEAARAAAEERERREKEEEKRRKEEARLERQRRIEEEKKNKGKKKPAQKKTNDEPEQEGVNKNDSREGIRAYARGRSYIPNRFGEVTPYTDPNQLFLAQAMEQAAKGKKKGKAQQAQAEEPEQKEQEQSQPVQAVPQAEEPKALEETPAVEEPVQAPEEEAAEETAVPSKEEDAPSGEEETDEDKEV
ncbi:YidC/Oxa1 family membrane protein insertase [Flavonifractor sp. An100]|uniref:YidC/Oxa1 family membrane protein insertase n=1 Tax=Flavonifractor sp. An100 TaxID=1965538 RepID=UPI001FA8EF5B|nr:YidC/Oxa1 family membrane protein insertase [Flavonifractor sp. An100]